MLEEGAPARASRLVETGQSSTVVITPVASSDFLPVKDGTAREHDAAPFIDSHPLELAMCWKCDQIDKEIEHYRGLSVRVTDEGSVKSLDILIAQLEAEKEALHIVKFKPSTKTAPPR
ncbi:hypothetical protein [Bradyrhizobium sp.]|uniref:hypothetical protein n=1 Tax=Bradyrhizobium sp. TaxID=376 RepID=UPI003C55561C